MPVPTAPPAAQTGPGAPAPEPAGAPPALDFEAMAAELLLALRGARSQTAWSRRLGYRSNVAYAWEAGRRWPTAAEALRACGRDNIDVADAISRFYGRRPAWLDGVDPASPPGVALLLDDLRGSASLVELARRAGLSRFSVARWLSGQTQPRLPDFLRVVEAASLRVVDLLTTLVPQGRLPTIGPLADRLDLHRRSAAEAPWLQAVVHALELEAYRALPEHRAGWIEARLGLPPGEEARCLALLQRAGRIRLEGGRFRSEGGALDTSPRPEVGRQLKAHWARVGAERAEQSAPGQFSYNVFTCSKADFERIRQAHLDYFRLLRSIVSTSAPEEVVAVANVQLFSLEPGRSTPAAAAAEPGPPVAAAERHSVR
jgi:DNA-binding phage protein